MTEKQLLNNDFRKYSGKDIDVYFKLDQCQHSGVCVQNLASVFDLKRKPWIQQDNATREEVKALINKCPSKALQYLEK